MHLLILNNEAEVENVRAQINAAPQGGFDLAGIKAAVALDEMLASAIPGEALELEDKDYGYLQDRMRTARWAIADVAIIDLVERCLNAPRKAESEAKKKA